MKHLSFLLILSVFLASCGQEVVPPSPAPAAPVKTEISAPVIEKEVAPVVESNSGVSEQTVSGAISSSGSTNETSFSDAQIQDILAKIDANTKAQQEIAKHATGVLVQGDFRAEYIAPKDYSKDTDKIIFYISGKKYEFPEIFYKKKAISGFIKCTGLKKNITLEDIHNNYMECGFDPFGGFIAFSPSGNYILYYSDSSVSLMDTRTGKNVLHEVGAVGYYEWTPDKKRFIFGGAEATGGGSGLKITIAGEFPKEKILSKETNIKGGLIKDNYLYVQTNKFFRVFDLTTDKEVFSKEIQN